MVVSVVLYFKFRKKSPPELKNDTMEKDKQSGYIIYTHEKKTNTPQRISKKYLSSPENDQMTFSGFIKIDNWYESFDNWKHILHKGSPMGPDSNATVKNIKFQAPGLWLFPKVNNLRVVVSIFHESDFKHKYCDILDIPVKEWFHIAVTIEKNVITVFINGKVVKICVFDGIPILTEGDLYLNQGITYDGEIKRIQFFNRIFSTNEIKRLYSKGIKK